MAATPTEIDLRRQVGELTARQREILCLIGRGFTTAEIARRLHRTVKTIESHRSSLGRKLGARNRVELALLAVKAGLVGESDEDRAKPIGSALSGLAGCPAKQALRAIDAGTCAATGQAFLDALVSQFAIAFDAQCVVIFQLQPSGVLHAVAAATPQGHMPRLSIPFAGSPCEDAKPAEVRSRKVNFQERYPQTSEFSGMNAQGILLTPLYDAQRVRLGTLAILHDGKLDDMPHIETVMRLFAGRVAAELERMESSKKLQQSLQRYSLLAEHSSDLITRITPTGTVTYVSPSSRELLGHEPQELLGSSIYDLIPKEDHVRVREAHEAILHECQRATVVHRVRRYDGATRWFETNFAAHRNGRAGVQWLAGASRDVTARRIAEERLIKSERLLSEAERIAEFGCWEWDLDAKLATWSDGTYRIFGYAPQSIMPAKEHVQRRLHPDDVQAVSDAFDEASETGAAIDCHFRVVLPDGAVRFIHGRAHGNRDAEGRLVSLIGTVHDVTDRRRAELAAVASEQRFRDIARAGADWIWELNADDVYVYCSEHISSILGYSADYIIGRTPFELMPDDEAERVRVAYERFKRQRLPFRDLENWNLTSDGQLVCLLTSGVPVFDEVGGFRGYRGVDRDITEQKLTEKTLKASEAHLRAAQAVARVGSWHVDLRTNKLTWSAQCCRLMGLPEDGAVQNEQCLSRIHPLDRQAVERAWSSALAGDPYDIEHRIVRDGEVRWMRSRATFDFGHDGLPLTATGTIEDITERKSLEDQLRRSQSMLSHVERIGQMGGWEWDVRADYVRCSDSLFEVLGMTEETLPRSLGVLLDTIIHEDDRDAVEQAFSEAVRQGTEMRVQARVRRGEDGWHTVEATGQVVLDEQGRAQRIVGATRGVTADDPS